MHPYLDQNDLLRYYFELKETCDTDPVLVGSKRAIGSINTNDL